MVNSKRWEKNSDEWVQTMHKSREMKERRKELQGQQGYKVELIFTVPLSAEDPFDWISEAVTQGQFKSQTNAIHATSVEPIDIDSDEYRWLRNASTS